LGVLIYEMLTGQLPFKGDYHEAIIYSILNEDQEPVTGLRTGVPMGLETIVNKCLEKAPSSRYQHTDELAVDLQKVKKELETKDTFSKNADRIVVPKKRVNQLSIAAGVVFILLLSFLGYFFLMDEGETTERIPIAVVDFVNKTNEPELNSLSGLLITSLEQSRRLSVFSRGRMFDVLRQMDRADVTFIDEATGREIAKREKVQALAVATIQKFGELYTIDFKVIEPETGDYLFTTKEEGRGQESIPAMIDRLSEKTRIDMKEQQETIQLASRGVADVTTTNLEAYHHYFLGEQLMSQIKNEKAEEEYRKAIALDSTFGLAYYRLAYAVTWDFGNELAAKEYIQKALALIDGIPEKESYLVQALNARIEKGHAAAIPILKRMERLYANEKEMLYNIGDLAFHADQFSTATEYLKKVLAMDPTFIRATQHLAWTYAGLGQYEKAIELAEEVLSINKTEGEGASSIGYVYQIKGDYPTAAHYFKSDSLDVDSVHSLSEIYRLSGQLPKALEYAKKYAMRARNPFSHFNLARVYNIIGEFSASLNTCKQALRLFPNHPLLLAGVGNSYAFMGDYGKAESNFRAMIAKEQPQAVRKRGYVELAAFYPYTGKFSEMMKMYDKQIEFSWADNDTNAVALLTVEKAYWMYWGTRNRKKENIENYFYYTRLAWLNADVGDLQKAKMLMNRFSENEGWTNLLEARIHQANNEWDEAILFYKSSSVVHPSFYYPPHYRSYVLAQCYYEKGELEEAIREVRNAQNYYGRFHSHIYPASFYLLGKIYEKKGDNQLAIQNYEKLLDLWKDADKDLPDLVDAKKRLAKLKEMSNKGS